jgi:fructose-1,6-bisphosphatase/inositol monophosphatase family enzyme
MTTDFVKKILLESGAILKSGFGKVTAYANKHDQSNIVTESDFKSEETIRKLIANSYPTHNILGEEHGFEDKKATTRGSLIRWMAHQTTPRRYRGLACLSRWLKRVSRCFQVHFCR